MLREFDGLSYSQQLDRLQPPKPVVLHSGQSEPIQAQGSGETAGQVKQAASLGIAGSSSALPHLDTIQQSFGGHDVSQVKAHLGSQAADANQAMGAKAFATGDNIAFAGSPDLHTAAHEAAHVVQQRAGVSLSEGVGQPGDSYERHADAVADRVVAGQSAESLLSATPGSAGGSSQTVQQAKDGDKKGTSHQVKVKINGKTVKLKFSLTEGSDEKGAFMKGKLELTEGLTFGGGPGIRVTNKTQVEAEVRDDQVTNISGTLEAIYFGADRKNQASLTIKLKSADFTGDTPLITGSATVKSMQDINLLGGAVTILPGIGFTVGVVNNELDSFTLSGVVVCLNRVTDAEGKPVVGRVETLRVARGPDGWVVNITGGKVDPVCLIKEKLYVGMPSLSLKDSSEFTAIFNGTFVLNPNITLLANGMLTNTNGWIPKLQLGAQIQVPLMEERTWFSKGGEENPWDLLDFYSNVNIYGVPCVFGIKVGAALEFGNTAIGLTSSIMTDYFELDPTNPSIPAVSGDLSITGGVFANASLVLTPRIGLGFEPHAFAGLEIPVTATVNPRIQPTVSGKFRIDGLKYGGEITLGVGLNVDLPLNFKPGFTVKFLGETWPSEPLIDKTYLLKDLLNWGDSFTLSFGNLSGKELTGKNLVEPVGEGLDKAKKQFEDKKKPSQPSRNLNGALPGVQSDGGLMADLKHIKNTADVIHKLLAYVGSIQELLRIQISNPPTFEEVVALFKNGLDFGAIVTRILAFEEACRQAEKQGTLSWLESKLPGGWKLLPAAIRAYLKTLNIANDLVEKGASLLGFETPAELQKRLDREMIFFNEDRKKWKQFNYEYKNQGLEWVWADNLAEIRVVVEKGSAWNRPQIVTWCSLLGQVTSLPELEAKALSQKQEAEQKAAKYQAKLAEDGLDQETIVKLADRYKDFLCSPDFRIFYDGTNQKNHRKGAVERTWKEWEQQAYQELADSPLKGKPPREFLKECGDDWNEVKKRYLSDERIMKRLCNYREAHVQALIAEIVAQPQFKEVKAKAVGSTALTSDYDVSFYGKGAIQAVPTFNAMFRTDRGWGKESGIVFDTNVYTASVLHYTSPADKTEQMLPVNDPEAKQYDNFIQDVASLAKIRRFMDAPRWQTHKENILAAIHDGEVRAETARRYDEADKWHQNYINELYAQIVANDPEVVKKYPGLSREEVVKKMTEGEAEATITASNRVYEGKLLLVQKKIDERDRVSLSMEPSPQKDKLIAQYNAEIRALYSEALMFANEAYYATGTLLHVVGNLQSNYQLNLGASEYFQSMNENYGDIKKDIGHYSGKPFGQAAYKTSKYLFRFVDAILRLVEHSDEMITLTGHSAIVPQLWKQAEKLLQIRQGKTMDGTDWSKAEESEKIKKAEEIAQPYAEIGQIESDVDKIDVDINAKARQKKIGP
ncbi:MAG: DUF4157 domain-containing protein [Bradymonadales bacterium]|nr:DUF4157 domain-containing protein [Bradymonadales bacterium]